MQALLDAGADRVSIADTVGYAGPARGARPLREGRAAIAGERFWCGHFHDTRGLALANVYAALETGVDRFDATLAGIGGCPHAPGASGNASSEDLAFMLAEHGHRHRHRHRRVAGAARQASRGGSTAKRCTARSGSPACRRPSLRRRPRSTPEATHEHRAAHRLPLDGVRVIEFTHMVMGPTCGMILADLGAEVIKVEPPGGDKTRKLPGLGIGFFRSFNRNKKSVVLDINTRRGPGRGDGADRHVRRGARELPARA